MNLNVLGWDWHNGKKGKDHCIPFTTLTPTNEWFIWEQLKLDHSTYTTKMIVEKMAEKMNRLKFGFGLIDPLANIVQSNVNTTVVFDINLEFRRLRKEGICNGIVFESWDTKSTLGRERIKQRLKNSTQCEKPGNNAVMDEKTGTFTYLPTIWIDRYKCPDIHRSIGKWCLDKNGEPEQQHSHFCTALEAIEKDIRFKAKMNTQEFERHSPYAKYFHIR